MLFSGSQSEFLLLSEHTYHSNAREYIVSYALWVKPELEKCHTDPCKDNWEEEVGGKGWKENNPKTTKNQSRHSSHHLKLSTNYKIKIYLHQVHHYNEKAVCIPLQYYNIIEKLPYKKITLLTAPASL